MSTHWKSARMRNYNGTSQCRGRKLIICAVIIMFGAEIVAPDPAADVVDGPVERAAHQQVY